MFFYTVLIVAFASSALSRNVPSFRDLDEEDQMLFRAAYDTPSYETPSYTQSYDTPYDHTDYHEEPLNKLDLLKDGMWAIKAKLKELKAFNKALAANLLSTKLKVKDLMSHHMQPLKKHHHVEIHQKPVYYPPPAHSSYPQYEQPHHTAPASHYTAPLPSYTEHAPQYNEHAPQYNEHAPQYTENVPQYSPAAPQYDYTAPAPQYTEPVSQYAEHAPQYSASTPEHTASPPQYNAHAPQYTSQQYNAPQYIHDPYYGH